jgi:hypothetical protein
MDYSDPRHSVQLDYGREGINGSYFSEADLSHKQLVKFRWMLRRLSRYRLKIGKVAEYSSIWTDYNYYRRRRTHNPRGFIVRTLISPS